MKAFLKELSHKICWAIGLNIVILLVLLPILWFAFPEKYSNVMQGLDRLLYVVFLYCFVVNLFIVLTKKLAKEKVVLWIATLLLLSAFTAVSAYWCFFGVDWKKIIALFSTTILWGVICIVIGRSIDWIGQKKYNRDNEKIKKVTDETRLHDAAPVYREFLEIQQKLYQTQTDTKKLLSRVKLCTEKEYLFCDTPRPVPKGATLYRYEKDSLTVSIMKYRFAWKAAKTFDSISMSYYGLHPTYHNYHMKKFTQWSIKPNLQNAVSYVFVEKNLAICINVRTGLTIEEKEWDAGVAFSPVALEALKTLCDFLEKE